MTHTAIHLDEAFAPENTPPAIQTYIFADPLAKVVSLDIGETGRGVFSVQLKARSARKLGTYLLAFADTADGIALPTIGDPTRDAPPLTDADFQEPVA